MAAREDRRDRARALARRLESGEKLMRHARRKLKELARRLPAVVFGLWLAGAGCAFCCATETTEGARAAEALSAPAHCPAHARTSAGEESGPASASATTSSPSDAETDSCCGFARRPSEPARAPRPSNERPPSDAREEFSRADDPASDAERPAARGRSPDLHATHLRCCVFLI